MSPHTETGKLEDSRRTGSIGSFRSLVSSLQKITSDSSSTAEAPEIKLPPDELPQTREGLEARLNYHLGELDRIRKSVHQRNEEIREVSYRLQIHERLRAEIPRAIQKLEELLDNAQHQRNSYAYFVDFHRGEIRRIGKQREELDISQGIRPATREMYKGFEREAEWIQLFSV